MPQFERKERETRRADEGGCWQAGVNLHKRGSAQAFWAAQSQPCREGRFATAHRFPTLDLALELKFKAAGEGRFRIILREIV